LKTEKVNIDFLIINLELPRENEFELENKIIKPKVPLINETVPLKIPNENYNADHINPSNNLTKTADEKLKLENSINVRKQVWELLRESKWMVIFAVFFSTCSGAIWSAYGILLASSIDALSQIKIVEENGKIMAGWFILVAAIAGICIALQK
jgi:hypothetical protein